MDQQNELFIIITINTEEYEFFNILRETGELLKSNKTTINWCFVSEIDCVKTINGYTKINSKDDLEIENSLHLPYNVAFIKKDWDLLPKDDIISAVSVCSIGDYDNWKKSIEKRLSIKFRKLNYTGEGLSTLANKIRYIMSQYRLQNYTKYADKYEVRQYIEEKYPGILVPLVSGPHFSADEIDFDSLPNQFMLKCTKGSHRNLKVTDLSSIDVDMVRTSFNKKVNAKYRSNKEKQYKFKGRLILEEYLGECIDYKFWCFNGKPDFVEVGSSSKDRVLYDMNWNLSEFQKLKKIPKEYDCPEGFNEMKHISEILSEDFDFVRVDLYNIEGKIYFGELTLTPSGGSKRTISYYPSKFNIENGNKLILTKHTKRRK